MGEFAGMAADAVTLTPTQELVVLIQGSVFRHVI